MNTGYKIKELRIKKGLTQQELGDMLGIQKAAVNKYETGRVVNLKRSTIKRLCEIFDVMPHELLGLEDQGSSGDYDIPYAAESESSAIGFGYDINGRAPTYKEIKILLSKLGKKDLIRLKDYITKLID